MIQRLENVAGRQNGLPYDIRIRPWYNPDFVTAFYMVPGIMGIILTMTMVMITSMAIVREREHGTLEQLIVTPLKSYELMLGKIIPYVFVGLVQAGVALMVGIIVFDLPIRGNMIELFLYTLLFIVASLSLGILISNFSKNQMQAMQMSFFIFLPSVLPVRFHVSPRSDAGIFLPDRPVIATRHFICRSCAGLSSKESVSPHFGRRFWPWRYFRPLC